MQTKEYQRAWRAANLEKARGYEAKYRAANRKAVNAGSRRWAKANGNKVIEYSRKWRMDNPDKARETAARWRHANPEILAKATRNWRVNNREYVNSKERRRCATDASYKLSRRLRHRLWHCIRLKSARKSASALNLVGCSIDELRHHLELKFTDKMNWQNYGKVWEVDHKQPCASFDMNDPKQQSACFHYSNLQPLPVSENRKKHAKLL